MIQTQLSRQDIEDVRVMVLRYMHEYKISSIAEVARFARLSERRLYSFMEQDRMPADVAVILISRLPLGVVYHPPRIEILHGDV